MRFTEKETNITGLETGFYRIKKDNSNSFITDNCGYKRELNSLFLGQQKLGQLEDTEEKLGINLNLLPTLLKIKKGDKIYAIDGTLVEAEVTSNSLVSGELMVFAHYPHKGTMYTPVCPYSKYGKTWALTKEELL